jgi:hypothetical protein
MNEELPYEPQIHIVVAAGIDLSYLNEDVVFLMLIERNGYTAERIGTVEGPS